MKRPPQPTLVPFLAAGFNFASGKRVREVPYDAHSLFLFDGEETSLAVRAWTHGYDFYHPDRDVVSHLYIPNKSPLRPVFWTEDWASRSRIQFWTMLRVNYLLGLHGLLDYWARGPRPSVGPYSLASRSRRRRGRGGVAAASRRHRENLPAPTLSLRHGGAASPYVWTGRAPRRRRGPQVNASLLDLRDARKYGLGTRRRAVDYWSYVGVTPDREGVEWSPGRCNVFSTTGLPAFPVAAPGSHNDYAAYDAAFPVDEMREAVVDARFAKQFLLDVS